MDLIQLLPTTRFLKSHDEIEVGDYVFHDASNEICIVQELMPMNDYIICRMLYPDGKIYMGMTKYYSKAVITWT